MKKFNFTVLLSLIFVFFSCSSDDNPAQEQNNVPTITSLNSSNILNTKATFNCVITNQGSSQVSLWGIVWSKTNQQPTISDNISSMGINNGEIGEKSLTIIGLEPGTTYYVRAYAKNEFGEGYSNQISITTSLTNYEVGDIGQAGGIIFYDKGNYSDGWRYLEATTENLGGPVWGCNGLLINANNEELGGGLENTNLIIQNCNDNVSAAKLCADYQQNGYSDWYLPSKEELRQMMLKRNSIGGFITGPYTSSTENSNTHSKGYNVINVSPGFQETNRPKQNNSYVRAIRRF